MNTTLFQNDKFGEIRNVMEGATPWFVANDVARALGYKDPAKAVSTIVDKKYKSVTKMVTLDDKKLHHLEAQNEILDKQNDKLIEALAKKSKPWYYGK